MTYFSEERGHKNCDMLIMRRLTVQCFIAVDKGPDGTWETLETIVSKLAQWLKEGPIKFYEDIQEVGVENYFNSLWRLFRGANSGKLMFKMY